MLLQMNSMMRILMRAILNRRNPRLATGVASFSILDDRVPPGQCHRMAVVARASRENALQRELPGHWIYSHKGLTPSVLTLRFWICTRTGLRTYAGFLFDVTAAKSTACLRLHKLVNGGSGRARGPEVWTL